MPAKSLFRALIALILLSAFALASVGRISAVNGEVSIQRGAKTEKAISSFQLEEKDVIKSTTNSTAQLIFNDKTVITVGSNTTFKIEEYLFSEKNSKARFNLGEGTFKTITGKIAKVAPDKFKVETKTATIGIRGTIFVGTINPQGFLEIACLKGEIDVTPVIPTLPPMIVKQGQMTIATPRGVERPRFYTPAQLQHIERPLTVQPRIQTLNTLVPSSGFTFINPINNLKPSTPAVTQNFASSVDGVVGEIKTTEKTTIVKKVAETCQAGYTGTYPNCVAPACQAGYTGTYPNCTAPSCPTGHTGTYPNCVAPACPSGYTGTYPNCVAPSCPTGYTGVYPACVAPACPSGYTGTYPNCVAPSCPTGYTGTYPNCVAPSCPTGYTGVYPACVAPACPSGYTGTYPNCVAPSCPTGYTGVYPACVAPACPSGYAGTYPNCVAPACPSGYTGVYPACVAPACPSGYTGTYPSCVAPPPTCPAGTSGTAPYCIPTATVTSASILALNGLYIAPSCSAGTSFPLIANFSQRRVANIGAVLNANNSIDSVFAESSINTSGADATLYPVSGVGFINGSSVDASMDATSSFKGDTATAFFLDITGASARIYGPILPMSSGHNIAAVYGTDYNVSGNYALTGHSVGYQIEKTKLGDLNTTSVGKALPVGTMTMTGSFATGAVASTTIMSIDSDNLTIGASSTLLSEDFLGSTFAATAGGITDYNASAYNVDSAKSYMVSMPDKFNGSSWETSDDYSSWGYWKSEASGQDLAHFGFWVGGVKTAQAEIDALIAGSNTTYNYTGHVMGAVLPTAGGAIELISMNSTNNATLNITFGSAASSITGNINFGTLGGQTWTIALSGSSGASTFNVTSSTSSFDIPSGGISGTGGADTISGGTLTGKFYGPGIKSVGGAFNADTAYHKASGVFKATRP